MPQQIEMYIFTFHKPGEVGAWSIGICDDEEDKRNVLGVAEHLKFFEYGVNETANAAKQYIINKGHTDLGQDSDESHIVYIYKRG